MSLEMYVFFRGKLPDRTVLNRTMKELGFDVTISPKVGSLEKQDGYMPMRLWREEAGVEFTMFGRDVIDDLTKGVDVDPNFDRCATFRWGGNEREMMCAMCAAAALAKLVNGTVTDSEEAKLRTPDEAVELAVVHMKQAQPAANVRSTRPTDLKHYLKALLTKRDDLALVGRILFVRPFRHLIRGVIFNPGGERYRFSASSHINPLYAARIGHGFHLEKVWQPHFEALLNDTLAEDVFSEVGAKTKLIDFADRPANDWDFPIACLTTLVLAGERDRAAEYAEQTLQKGGIAFPDSFKERWAFLQGDIATICNHFHAIEEAAVKKLRFEKFWDRAPFPVEVPIAERRSKSDEALFRTTPWITTPSWLLQDLPDTPADVRFAKDIFLRADRMLLLVPLTRVEAEERHREREPYVLITRLADGSLLELRHESEWDRNNPSPKFPKDYPILYEVILRGPARSIKATVAEHEAPPGMVEFWIIEIRENNEHEDVWSWRTYDKGISKFNTDRRIGKKSEREWTVTAAERELLECPMPAFGEHEEFVRRTQSWLKIAGFDGLA